MVEPCVAHEAPHFAVRSVHRRHLDIRRSEVGVDPVRAFTRSEGVCSHEIIRKSRAQASTKGARTVVFIRQGVVVVCCRVGATRNGYLGEHNGNALFVERGRGLIVPLEVHGQVDHAICRELTNQNAAIRARFCIRTLVGEQEPRSADERIHRESTSRFECIEIGVHTHLLHVARAVGVFRTDGEPAVVLKRRERREEQRVDGLGQDCSDGILVKRRRNTHDHRSRFKGVDSHKFIRRVVERGVHAIGRAVRRFSDGFVLHANKIGESHARGQGHQSCSK